MNDVVHNATHHLYWEIYGDTSVDHKLGDDWEVIRSFLLPVVNSNIPEIREILK